MTARNKGSCASSPQCSIGSRIAGRSKKNKPEPIIFEKSGTETNRSDHGIGGLQGLLLAVLRLGGQPRRGTAFLLLLLLLLLLSTTITTTYYYYYISRVITITIIEVLIICFNGCYCFCRRTALLSTGGRRLALGGTTCLTTNTTSLIQPVLDE